MSKPQEEEEDEEERETEEKFYESLDRILSSSNSSTSNSDDDDAAGGRFSRRSNRHGKPTTKSPLSSAQNYDVWTSTESFSLSSLEQRRDRLLLSLGLSSDSSLSRRSYSTSGDFGRSNSTQRNSTSSILSICSVSHTVNSNGNNKYDCNASNNFNGLGVVVGNLRSNGFSGSVSSSNKPPLEAKENGLQGVKEEGFNRVGVVGNLRSNGFSGSGSSSNKPPLEAMENGLQGVKEEGLNGVEKVDRICRIKNLDNGKEFVVNEVREDGMWNKLKEVGTGRQLTMEEFEICVGHSPIVQELMRRQNVEDHRNNNSNNNNNNNNGDDHNLNGISRNGNVENGSKSKKKVSWFRSIKNVASSVAGYKERRSSDERDSSSDKGGRRSSSATDDSQDASFHGPERVRVRQYGKSVKELSALYKSQEIKAHNGSIWTIKFSLDGRYLASAGEDCVIHVWQVVESEKKGEMLTDRPDDGSLNLLFLTNGSPEPNSFSLSLENPLEKRKKGRTSISRKSINLDHIMVPETVFGLSEKPICSFQGHSDDVLDLSWSKSQLLLSSSMDKTVRLWNLASNTCLKIFSHNDYVTCIQFNPVDDRYFISGSLDAKVRIWSIPDHQVVDWNDLHEMVTAACYTPDGQGALVGSYKGSCRLYNTSENKLQQKCHINLQNRRKKSHLKKITGFQFAPGSSSEVLITSADSRVRVVDGVDLVHKFKGFRNTNSQISASLTANGKYVVCASEDSHVYIWKHEGDSQPSRSKSIKDTRTYEHFHCQDVSIAIPWPGITPESWDPPDHPFSSKADAITTANHPPTPVEEEFSGNDSSASSSGCGNSPFRSSTISSAPKGYFDKISVTWPEDSLLLPSKKDRTPRPSFDFSNGVLQNRSAWGMVIVTAGIRGEIRTFQNFGFPVRI